jgi:hypothetical protein
MPQSTPHASSEMKGRFMGLPPYICIAQRCGATKVEQTLLQGIDAPFSREVNLQILKV